MKAVVWHGKEDVRVDNVPDPAIEEPTDAFVRITSTAICGSDLDLYGGFVIKMKEGDIIGHELATHRLPLGQAPAAYEKFQQKEDGAIKVVLQPGD